MPTASASAVAVSVIAVTRLLRRFIVGPLPQRPEVEAHACPSLSSSGQARCTSCSAPPTMNTNSPASAPHCAPDTGASIIEAPRACTASRGLARQPRLGRRRVDEQRAGAQAGAPHRRRRAPRRAPRAPLGNIVNTASASRRTRARWRMPARQAARAASARSLCGDVEALDAMARASQVARHRHPHHAEADEADGQLRAHASARPIRIFCTSLVPS